MGPRLVLEQAHADGEAQLVLDDRSVVDKKAAAGSRVVLTLRDVAAVLRDAERVHIVGASGTISFWNEPGRPEFEAFVDQLLRRLQV